MIIRWADLADGPMLLAAERLIPEEKLLAALEQQRILVAVQEEALMGWLRFGWFWDSLPFMNLLFILPRYRRQGVGKKLVACWEAQMKILGHRQVLTSTQADEEAQHFYRNLGYHDAGTLHLTGQPLEWLLCKELTD